MATFLGIVLPLNSVTSNQSSEIFLNEPMNLKIRLEKKSGHTVLHISHGYKMVLMILWEINVLTCITNAVAFMSYRAGWGGVLNPFLMIEGRSKGVLVEFGVQH